MNPSVANALNRIRGFLNDKNPRRLLSVCHEPTYRQVPDDDWVVATAAEIIRKNIAAADEDNALPFFSPDFGTVSTAAIYGGKRIDTHGPGKIHIEPVAATVEDLLKLQPAPFEETDYQRALDLYRRVCERVGGDEDVFLRTPDFQGPLNTIALLLRDQGELMIGMYEEPEIVREFARRVTDTLIDYVARFRAAAGPGKVIGNIWPFVGLPDDGGVGITQDYMPLLGPELYAEFELPLLKKIADRFGGVYIHCCGKYKPHLRNLAAAGINIIGLECHYPETTVEDIYEVFGDRVAITPYIAPTGVERFPNLSALIRSWRGKPCAAARLWVCSCHEWENIPELRRALDELG